MKFERLKVHVMQCSVADVADVVNEHDRRTPYRLVVIQGATFIPLRGGLLKLNTLCTVLFLPHRKLLAGALIALVPFLGGLLGTADMGSHVSRPRVAHVRPVVGVDALVPATVTVPEIRGRILQTLKALKKDLSVNSVSLNFALYQDSDDGGLVYASPTLTPSPADVELIAREAETLHMSVAIRPTIGVLPCKLVDDEQERCSWEGQIQPANETAWFNSLYNAELPYLEVAKQIRAVYFVPDSELFHLALASQYWTALYHRDRQVAPTMNVQSANSTMTYFPGPKHYPALVPNNHYVSYGLDFYPVSGSNIHGSAHLSKKPLGPGTSAATLSRLMVKLFETVQPRQALQDTVIDETGIPAVPTAYIEPSKWGTVWHEPTDSAVQAKWFEAVCGAIKTLHMRGVYFYNVPLTIDPTATNISKVAFLGRPASMRAIRHCAEELTGAGGSRPRPTTSPLRGVGAKVAHYG